MKYQIHHYADAFVSLYQDAPEAERKMLPHYFVEALVRHRMLGHQQEIVRLIQQKLAVAHGGHVVKIEFARVPSDGLLSTVARFLSKHDEVETKITPALIAGMRVTVNGSKELDMSLRRRLDELFTTPLSV